MNRNESESGKSQATNIDMAIPKEILISVDQIEIVDADRLREDDDPKTISEYRETYLMRKNDDGSFSDPFPPCGGFINESSKFVVTAGRHRIIAGRDVGVKEFRCIVFPDEESAIWHGLGDNCKNGLRNRPADLKKMIEIALLNFTESNRAIAEHIGCSPSWVDKISRQVRTSTHLPEKRVGRDRKLYPTQSASHNSKSPETTPKGAGASEITTRTEESDSAEKKVKAEASMQKEEDPGKESGKQSSPSETHCQTKTSAMDNSTVLQPDDDTAEDIVRNWLDSPGRVKRLLDIYEEKLISDAEKQDFYKTIKRWLGTRIKM